MRSYRQYCAVAKALDVVGDRWTLLIVRELAVRGACRYTDLRNGLPGIATNLLADRLRELEDAGVVSREKAPPPVASTIFRLTARGQALRPVLDELGRWGIRYMADGPAPGDSFREEWLAWPAEIFLADSRPQEPAITIEVWAGEEPMVIETVAGTVRARPGRAEHADAVVRGTPHEVLALLSGQLDLAAARERGLHFSGEASALERVCPKHPPLVLAGD